MAALKKMMITSSCKITRRLGEYESISCSASGETEITFETADEMHRKQSSLAVNVLVQATRDVENALRSLKPKCSDCGRAILNAEIYHGRCGECHVKS